MHPSLSRSAQSPGPFHIWSLVLAVLALLVVLRFNLLVAVLAGCASYALAHGLRRTWLFRGAGERSLLVASFAVAAIPLVVLVGIGVSIGYLSAHAASAFNDITVELARIIEQWRNKLPGPIVEHLPTDVESVKPWLAELVKAQSEKLTALGKSGAHGALMTVVGVVIGLLLANLRPSEHGLRPLSAMLVQRASRLQSVFTSIVVAQFWIAAINTVLTAVFFYVILPLFGAQMPYAPALLAFTFLSGMLPVVGNLLCNLVMTVVALSVSPVVAAAALSWLILIHKLEYFISAKVVGAKSAISAWEILAAMFTLEAIFGIPGLVAAPFFYAFLKLELRALGWIGEMPASQSQEHAQVAQDAGTGT